MLIIVPWRTDAPVYHRPWATLGLIVANILVYALLGTPEPRTFFGEQAPANAWVLHFDEIGPLTWLTHFFVHGGLVHLLGNMIFLWTFGLVVEEGREGPRRCWASTCPSACSRAPSRRSPSRAPRRWVPTAPPLPSRV